MNSTLHFHFITLFPETIRVWMETSMIGRALEAGIFQYDTLQLRDFSDNKHNSVDDVAYGGGGGMVLRVDCLVRSVESLWERYGRENCQVIYFSPAGEVLSHRLALDFAKQTEKRHFILVCGHYEGVDERFIEGWVDRQVSLGDFVLTGGELPALAFADATIRQIEGALGGRQDGAMTESFSLSQGGTAAPLLEYPHYTRPQEFRGSRVPDVLLSGNHEKIRAWRESESSRRTHQLRPDLLKNNAANQRSSM